MRVLVTGSGGFIASYVIPRLRDRGDDVSGIDLHPPAGMPYSSPIDITSWGELTQRLGLEKFDRVLHLAAIASPRDCEGDPARAFDVNVRGTYNVLRLAAQCDAKVIFASSAHVYGIPPAWAPTPERAPRKPQDPYTVTKILGEELCARFAESYQVPYVSLRLYNGYGPGQPLGYFIPDTIKQAREHGRITVRGARVTKDWLYITDMVNAIVAALTSPGFNGAVNIGSGQDTSLLDVAKIIGARMGVPVAPAADLEAWAKDEQDRIARGFPPYHPESFMRADVDLAKRMLPWEPKVSLEDGLHSTISAAVEERRVAASV